ncbi:MAG TPA: helix-turn-helix transcriptional regulator [Roseiarcus sp.]|nr:helix-turn-helix transcriptional regulator [Roseiarcus sp.]
MYVKQKYATFFQLVHRHLLTLPYQKRLRQKCIEVGQMSRRKRPAGLDLEPTYLLAWRKFRDMSLEDVGKRMGIDKTAISRIERGLTPYDQIHLQQMSEIYRATIPDLLYTDPLRQTQPNQFGMVGFQNAPKPGAKKVRREPSDLTEMASKLKLPEEIDAVKMIIEALAARRKEGD